MDPLGKRKRDKGGFIIVSFLAIYVSDQEEVIPLQVFSAIVRVSFNF